MTDELNITLENLRGTYQEKSFDTSDCKPDPIVQFDEWLEDSIKTKCDEPNAFVLSTIQDGKPRARVVLLKGIYVNSFVFYTNYESAKGQEIDSNDNVALTFLWLPLQRQIRIEGKIKKIPEVFSDEYFHKRPRGSQIGAIASPQSKKVSSRKELEDFFHKVEELHAGNELLPRPSHWGGYAVEANFFEFWQGRNNRMHDRVCYENKNDKWEIYRLAP